MARGIRNPSSLKRKPGEVSTLWCTLSGTSPSICADGSLPSERTGGIGYAWSSSHPITVLSSNIPDLALMPPFLQSCSGTVSLSDYFACAEYFVELTNSMGESRRSVVRPPCPCTKLIPGCDEFFESEVRGPAGKQPNVSISVSGIGRAKECARLLNGTYVLAPCAEFQDRTQMQFGPTFELLSVRRYLRYEIGPALDATTDQLVTVSSVRIDFCVSGASGRRSIGWCGRLAKPRINSFEYIGCDRFFSRDDCQAKSLQKTTRSPYPPNMNGAFSFSGPVWSSDCRHPSNAFALNDVLTDFLGRDGGVVAATTL